MKASELIQTLEKLIAEQGDQDVIIVDVPKGSDPQTEVEYLERLGRIKTGDDRPIIIAVGEE